MSNMSKRTKSIFVFLFFLFFWGIIFAHAEIVDKILVIVNDEIITQGEIDRILRPIYEQYKNLYSGEELIMKLDEVRKGILQKLIQDKVLLTEAKRRQIEVKDEEVEAKIDEVRKGFVTDEEFKKALEQENLPLSELKKKHKERIMIDKLIDMEIRRRVSISPNEVILFYESHKNDFQEPEKIKVRSILIKANEKRSEEEALKLANEMINRINEGSDFGLLAKKYSDGPYADAQGDMGWVKKGELMKDIDNVIFHLEKGEVSGIIKTNLGFHIFKVDEKMPARSAEFGEVKSKIEQILFNRKVEEELGKWLKKLKENAYIAFR